MTTSPSLKAHQQIILVAFGTSTEASSIYFTLQRRFEERFHQQIPLAFTSRVGSPKLAPILEGLEEGLEVVITPLLVVPGKVLENDIQRVAREYAYRFSSIRVASPLLPDDRIDEVLKDELLPDLNRFNPAKTGIIFVGHGSPHEKSALLYSDLARRLSLLFPPPVKAGFGNVEFSSPYIGEVLGELIMSDITSLIVQPFMIVDGVHLRQDVQWALESQSSGTKLLSYLTAIYGESVKKRLGKLVCSYKPGLGAYRGVFELLAEHTLCALQHG